MLRLKTLQEADDGDLEKLTEREIYLLKVLKKEEGKRESVRVGDLRKAYAKAIGKAENDIPLSTISTITTKLWRNKKQLIEKERDRENLRTMNVSLANEGKLLLEKLDRNQSERFEILMRAFSLNEEESNLLTNIIKRAISGLDNQLEKSRKVLEEKTKSI